MFATTWKIGAAAPDPQLATGEFFDELGQLVGKGEALKELGSYLTGEYGVPTVGMLMEQLTATGMRDSLQHCGMRESYEATIGQFLTGPDEPNHKFKVPRKRGCSDVRGGTKEKKACAGRGSLTVELGGSEGLERNLFALLDKDIHAWCTVPPKPNRLDQMETNTITACFTGAVVQHTQGNMYVDTDFLAATQNFLEKHWPLLNIRSGNPEKRTWRAAPISNRPRPCLFPQCIPHLSHAGAPSSG